MAVGSNGTEIMSIETSVNTFYNFGVQAFALLSPLGSVTQPNLQII